jgi:GDP-L-fucose synthase
MQHGLEYVVVIPNNIYGPGDNYHPENSHVMASLIRKFDAAIESNTDVEIWGSGNQMREFVYVDDVASACVMLMSSPEIGSFNCSSEVEVTIKELANIISEVLGFVGNITYNIEKPEGHMRKGFSCENLRSIGWTAHTDLKKGIRLSHDWYKQNIK